MDNELKKIFDLSDTIILDFDGVVLDSVNIKGECFYDLYKSFNLNIAKNVLDHHLKNGGMSRYDKFKFYHKEYLDIEIDERSLNDLVEKFKNLSLKKIIKAPQISGVFNFIKKNFNRKDLYICSAAPKNELDYILKKINLFKFFKGIYGSPTSKRNNLINIINKEINKNYIFIGDSINDYSASKNLNLDFIGLGDYFKNNTVSKFYIENFLFMNSL